MCFKADVYPNSPPLGPFGCLSWALWMVHSTWKVCPGHVALTIVVYPIDEALKKSGFPKLCWISGRKMAISHDVPWFPPLNLCLFRNHQAPVFCGFLLWSHCWSHPNSVHDRRDRCQSIHYHPHYLGQPCQLLDTAGYSSMFFHVCWLNSAITVDHNVIYPNQQESPVTTGPNCGL